MFHMKHCEPKKEVAIMATRRSTPAAQPAAQPAGRRIIVTGGGTYRSRSTLATALEALDLTPADTLLIGGNISKGAEYLAREWAATNQQPVEIYETDWSIINQQGRKVGFVARNEQMFAANPTHLVVFDYEEKHDSIARSADEMNRNRKQPLPVRRVADGPADPEPEAYTEQAF